MTARTDDYDAIVRVVRLYVDAFNDNDIGKLTGSVSRRCLDFLSSTPRAPCART